MQASVTSARLCGGMLVAMPTAMPPAPLTRRLGNFAGSTTGSRPPPARVGWETTRVFARASRAASAGGGGVGVVLGNEMENAAGPGLQSGARVGKRARHDHAHGVIEIRALHLVDERDGPDVRGDRALDLCLVVVSQGRRKPI